MKPYPKRLIEVDLPIARISAHARREKSIRHGHISTLHIWWARRPLAACRAVICAALWPDPADDQCPPRFRQAAVETIKAFAKRVFPDKVNQEGHELQQHLSQECWERWQAIAAGTLTLDANQPADMPVLRMALLDFVADFANWDNGTERAYLETSRTITQAAQEALGGQQGTRPLVVDPFAGGGSIPLEAIRIGADAFASDLNPIPVLLNKVVLEYVPKYGQRLADEVRRWGAWIKERAEVELAEFYPAQNVKLEFYHPQPKAEIKRQSGGTRYLDSVVRETPIAYLWARTILSEAPGQGDVPVEVPLMRSFWLAKKAGVRTALRWVRDESGQVKTETLDVTYLEGGKPVVRKVKRPQLEIFEPKKESEVPPATVARGSATCPVTGYTTKVDSVRAQLKHRSGGAADARLFAVVATLVTRRYSGRREYFEDWEEQGRFYRLPTSGDQAAFQTAAMVIASKSQEAPTSRLSPVPTEMLDLRGIRHTWAMIYGLDSWGTFFTPRQQLTLVSLIELVHAARSHFESEVSTEEADAIETILGLAVSRLTDICNSLCGWSSSRAQSIHALSRQAIPMLWDFAEPNVLADAAGNYDVTLATMVRVIEACIFDAVPGQAVTASATSQPLPDDSADVLCTDPPYYDAVPYAYLSDFFYVWLRRALGHIHSELFASSAVPKDTEIVVDRMHELSDSTHDVAFYESQLQLAFADARRVVRANGVGVIVFASKTTASWEALLGAVINAGWIVTGSWPIDTEREARVSAIGQARLGSSVHLVCRPREDMNGAVTELAGEWRDVLVELPRRIHEWMPRLAAEGVVGADAIFACLGPALEIFSRYARVEKANGEDATLREYLEHVWAAVSTEALSLIFKDANAAGLEPDARLSAMWLWTIGGGGTNGNGKRAASDESSEDDDLADESDDEDSTSGSKGKARDGFLLEYDAARKIAQGLGVHLEQCESLVEIKGDKARLLPVAERTAYLFGKGTQPGTSGAGRKKKVQQKTLFAELDDAEAAEAGWSALKSPPPGTTVLDRVHQAMILFAANRAELLKRFLVEDGVGKDARFWKLADNLNKLYPPGTDERRWIEGVLARKKGLGQ